jgi:hypothetical protein
MKLTVCDRIDAVVFSPSTDRADQRLFELFWISFPDQLPIMGPAKPEAHKCILSFLPLSLPTFFILLQIFTVHLLRGRNDFFHSDELIGAIISV